MTLRAIVAMLLLVIATQATDAIKNVEFIAKIQSKGSIHFIPVLPVEFEMIQRSGTSVSERETINCSIHGEIVGLVKDQKAESVITVMDCGHGREFVLQQVDFTQEQR